MNNFYILEDTGELKNLLSQLSGIPEENIEFSRVSIYVLFLINHIHFIFLLIISLLTVSQDAVYQI